MMKRGLLMIDIEDKLGDLIKNAMKENLLGKENWPFQDPDDYAKRTGRRFRMTADQKNRGLTREEAFRESMENMVSK